MKEYFKAVHKYFSITVLAMKSIVLAGIVLLLDFYNVSKYVLGKIPNYIIIFVMMLFVLLLFQLRLRQAFKIISISLIDAIFLSFFYSDLLIIFVYLFTDSTTVLSINYKSVFLICLLVLCVIVILRRIIRFNSKRHYEPNIVDLRQIINNESVYNDDLTIFVSEKDVDYDLLDRGVIINRLLNAVCLCTPDQTFTISVEGPWGSGKTTLLNILKKQLHAIDDENVVIIDKFDPWAYGDQEAMLYHLFDTILVSAGVKFSYFTVNKLIKEIASIIIGKYPPVSIFNYFHRTTNIISEMKQRINDFLILNNKKIVVFIDNIDRAESENVILLFKLLGDVINFSHTIYILSFDSGRVKKIFESDLLIDVSYLKKIIQMPINVPVIPAERSNEIFLTCMRNIIIGFGENPDSYQALFECVCAQIKDLRDFKRILNSIVLPIMSEKIRLNKYELIALEYIRFQNPELYYEIYKNRTYFISADRHIDLEIFPETLHTKEFNEKGKAFFEKIFIDEGNAAFKDLLADIFPYVKNYSNDRDLESQYRENKSEDFSLSSAKFFDLYFCMGSNEHLKVSRTVKKLVGSLNNEHQHIGSCITTFINEIPMEYHKEAFEVLYNNLNNIKQENSAIIAQELWNSLEHVDEKSQFLALTARQRVIVIISDLLSRISIEDYRIWAEYLALDYKKVYAISELLSWFNKRNKDDEKETILRRTYQKLCEEIVNTPIDLYDDNYYSHQNIWGLNGYYSNNIETLRKYFADIISTNNIYRFLWDMIRLSYGSRVEYSINHTYFQDMANGIDIDSILMLSPPLTNSEKFIFDVYMRYKSGETDEWGHNSLVKDEIIKIKL